eukprot:4747197-Pleurochrysis_carterae.AAC.1
MRVRVRVHRAALLLSQLELRARFGESHERFELARRDGHCVSARLVSPQREIEISEDLARVGAEYRVYVVPRVRDVPAAPRSSTQTAPMLLTVIVQGGGHQARGHESSGGRRPPQGRRL